MKHLMQNPGGLRVRTTRGRQEGAVLVFGLILLLVLTLLGVSTMNGSIFDEKMAGNAINGNYAFQASESALREGELWLRDSTIPPLKTVAGSSGVWQKNAPGAGDGGQMVVGRGVLLLRQLQPSPGSVMCKHSHK